MFRLTRDKAIINRMGFNNPGADSVAEQLWRQTIRCPIGINIGKTKVVAEEDAKELSFVAKPSKGEPDEAEVAG